MHDLKIALIEKYGYNEASAERTVVRLNEMVPECIDALKTHSETGELENLSCGEYDIEGLISDYNVSIPSAFLTISDLKKDYEKYSSLLKRGIK